jgi:hypothetical protein
MSYFFKLFSIELQTHSPDILDKAIGKFADSAEVSYYNRKSGKTILQFISTASEDQIVNICDEFKKEVELSGSDRLYYRVITIR